MADRIQTQRAEFDAVERLAEQYRRITMTPVVDDDYPEVRHDYEGALAGVLRAMKDNGRFEQGNRYGLAAPHLAQPQPSSYTTAPYASGVTEQEPTAADTERLDWMLQEFEKNGCLHFDRYGPGVAGCQLFTVSSQHVRGKNLREAIDKAREIAREPKA